MVNTMAGLVLGGALVAGNVGAEGTNTDKVGQNLDQVDKTLVNKDAAEEIKYGTKGRLSELLGQCDIIPDGRINIRSDIGKTGPDGNVITRADVIKEVRCEQKFDHEKLDQDIAELDKSIAANKAKLLITNNKVIQARKDFEAGRKSLEESKAIVLQLEKEIENIKNEIRQKISKK